MPDHFYTLDFYGELAPGSYEREGITGYVYTSQQPGTVPVFRWYNPSSHDHFYTTDPSGEIAPQHGYHSEGVAWYMFKDRHVNTVPLYRWYNSQTSDHFYTTDPSGEVGPPAYHKEGILGYLHPTAAAHSVAIYRWYQSGLLRNFSFDNNITQDQRRRLLERHTWAYFRAGICGNITQEEKDRVRKAYREKNIYHSVSTNASINASAYVGGDSIAVNFTNLFPQGDNEIAQTLLHEMMHCAGYTHPQRIDAPNPNADVPFDGGKYYGTAPLRAELCIAGVQSDAATVNLTLASNAVTQSEMRACPVVTEEAQEAKEAKGAEEAKEAKEAEVAEEDRAGNGEVASRAAN